MQKCNQTSMTRYCNLTFTILYNAFIQNNNKFILAGVIEIPYKYVMLAYKSDVTCKAIL